MDIEEYERLAKSTLLKNPDFRITDKQVMISWFALGLSGEAGEVADLVKKGIYHQQGLDYGKLKKELGDVMWYISALADQLDMTLSEIMQANIEKLQARFPEGYDPQRTTFRGGKAE